MLKRKISREKIATAALTVVFIAAVLLSFLPVKYTLTLEAVNSPRKDVLQVFYNVGSGFSEVNSRFIIVPAIAISSPGPVTARLTVPLPAMKITGIRIDPGTGPKAWNINSIILEAKFAGRAIRSRIWLPEDIFRDFAPLHAIDVFSVRNKMLFLNASGEDPYFGYRQDFEKVQEPLLETARHLKTALWGIAAVFGSFLLLVIRKAALKLLIDLLQSAKQLFRPFLETRSIFPLWFWILLGILTLIKLWLVSAQTITALTFAVHDDGLFMKLARNIVSGTWLGQYDNLTLAKAPFYPLWIAAMFFLGIPLCFSQQLLYICGCLVFIIAMRPLTRNIPFLSLIFYATLLFHPVSYPVIELQRVAREGIYLSLPLLVLSFALGLLLRKDCPGKKLIIWNIGLGLSFAAFWLTREEGVILLPSLFLLLAALVVGIVLFSPEKLKRLKICCISAALAFAGIGAVAGLNKIYYGIFTACEQTQSDLTKAYGALLRVTPLPFQRYLPVSRETRERIYAASPAFAELRPFLEGELGKNWGAYGPYKGKDISTHFNWAFRDAVSLAGYYSSGDSAAKYYRRLAIEVNAACDGGLLECYKARHNSLAPVWHKEYLKPLISTFSEMAVAIVRLEKIQVQFRPLSAGEDKGILFFMDMTRDRIAPREGYSSLLIRQQRLDALKLRILNSFLSFFRSYLFVLALSGTLLYLCHMVLVVVKRKISAAFIIATALLLAVLARIFLLSLIDVTSWPGSSQTLLYQSSLYPLLTAFFMVAIAMCFFKDNDEHAIPFSAFRRKNAPLLGKNRKSQ